MKKTKIVLTLLCCIVLLAGAAKPAFAESDLNKLTSPRGEIVGIAHRGLWGDLPENSLEAFRAAKDAGLELVLADVSLTKDGVPVVLEAHSAARMLSGAEQTDVSVYTLAELEGFALRRGMGGAGNGETPCKAPTLDALFADAAQYGYVPVLKFDCALTGTVTDAAGKAGFADKAVLYPTGKTADVLEAVKEIGGAFPVIAEKRSNVIFSVLSFIHKLEDADAQGAVLKTTNRYGVIFYKSTLKQCESLRAMANLSDTETAGWREDTEKWWDDLISRGYSAVITNDPAGFAAYVKENDAARERLRALYGGAESMTLPSFGSALASDYEKNYKDALKTASTLLSDASCSTLDLRDAYVSLQSAVNEINVHFDEINSGAAGSTVTLPRILLCVGAAAAVISAQVYFYRKRK